MKNTIAAVSVYGGQSELVRGVQPAGWESDRSLRARYVPSTQTVASAPSPQIDLRFMAFTGGHRRPNILRHGTVHAGPPVSPGMRSRAHRIRRCKDADRSMDATLPPGHSGKFINVATIATSASARHRHESDETYSQSRHGC